MEAFLSILLYLRAGLLALIFESVSQSPRWVIPGARTFEVFLEKSVSL